MSNQQRWQAYVNGQEVLLDNENYLKLLLDRSDKAIRSLDHSHICFIMYDLEEIKEENSLFYSLNNIRINSEINSLKRFLKLNSDIIKYDEYQRICKVNNTYKSIVRTNKKYKEASEASTSYK